MQFACFLLSFGVALALAYQYGRSKGLRRGENMSHEVNCRQCGTKLDDLYEQARGICRKCESEQWDTIPLESQQGEDRRLGNAEPTYGPARNEPVVDREAAKQAIKAMSNAELERVLQAATVEFTQAADEDERAAGSESSGTTPVVSKSPQAQGHGESSSSQDSLPPASAGQEISDELERWSKERLRLKNRRAIQPHSTPPQPPASSNAEASEAKARFYADHDSGAQWFVRDRLKSDIIIARFPVTAAYDHQQRAREYTEWLNDKEAGGTVGVRPARQHR